MSVWYYDRDNLEQTSIPEGVTGTYFMCAQTLTKIPPLPNSLKLLYSRGCANVKEIPPLPPSLEIFNCSCFPVEELPPLPNTLQVLICWGFPNLRTLPPHIMCLWMVVLNYIFLMIYIEDIEVRVKYLCLVWNVVINYVKL